ncbi:MAG: exo-beta-N-acetylmuramidase NamZ family protein, partial [Flavitalea sp.]
MTPFRLLIFVLIMLKTNTYAQQFKQSVTPASHRISEYLPLLKGKAVAVFANHTSMIHNTHLVDTLRSKGINIKKIFAPEHGFRGTADAGSKIDNAIDPKTGIPVISLYGKKIRPSDDDLSNIDILVFDIQDVGVRFYTYISSLEEYMVAAIRNNKPLVVLDRPNPNGFYIDGPVLDPKFKSFVGMQPVPVVYGMTMGEYAKMLCGENMFDSTTKSKRKQNNWNKLTVIKNANYDHNSLYELPVKPSPNLPDNQSIYLYPTTCFIEGTVLSEGRGTPKPFKVFGHPSLPKNMYSFTPKSMEGATNPKLKDQTCYGWDLSSLSLKDLNKQISLN